MDNTVESPLGDLEFASGSDQRVVNEVLKSVETDDSSSEDSRVSQSVNFLVKVDDNVSTSSEGSLVLCWVDSEGKLHHHYTFNGNILDHTETTYTGDAFVVYHHLHSSDESDHIVKPKTTLELLDGEAFNILCSYRLREEVDKKTHVHLVQWSPNGCKVTRAPNDNEYRVVAGLPKDFPPRLPPPNKSWEVTYTYICPPIPNASTGWNKNNQTFYIWGDLDFDLYGASHLREVIDERIRNVHDCTMNQIVPQVMIGNCLCSNDEQYIPSWQSFDTWVIQAQYFWQDCDEGPRAMCGPLVNVKPGDEIHTQIRYDHETGSIVVSIAVMKEDDHGEKMEDAEKRSEIIVERPFPHTTQFDNWKDFFERCMNAECDIQLEDESTGKCCDDISNKQYLQTNTRNKTNPEVNGCLARPYLNIEYKGKVSIGTLKSVCPLIVHKASFPGFESKNTWRRYLFCPRVGDVDTLDALEREGSLHIDDAISMIQSKREDM